MRGRWILGGLEATWRMLSLGRGFHGLKVGLTYLLARLKLGWSIPAYPLFLGVEPTTACNLRCPHCISGLRGFTRPMGRLDPLLLEALLEEVHPYLWGVLFYFQGEPLLHPEIGRLILLVSRYNLLSSLSTNGHFLSEEHCYELITAGLTHLRVSLDGMTPESYQRYRRGGNLEVVQEGVKRLLLMRRRMRSRFPLVELQFIAFRHNIHEISAFRTWAKAVGVDYFRIKTAQLLSPTSDAYDEWIPEEFSRYEKGEKGTVRLKGKLPNRCWRLWRAAEVTWDGQVVPCCFDKNAQHGFGSLQTQPFSQIWRSSKAHAFRQRVFQARESIDICRNCSEGVRTWV
ncbi:MAG: radical SAM/SPASM domain-containing protein [Bacteroidia bacterium]|nr:radical SAM protein [Bacteroidia bacterium]MDW8014586.1 radical SAM/SPASM domain-containing protein [Bacteroidia bacterium]